MDFELENVNKPRIIFEDDDFGIEEEEESLVFEALSFMKDYFIPKRFEIDTSDFTFQMIYDEVKNMNNEFKEKHFLAFLDQTNLLNEKSDHIISLVINRTEIWWVERLQNEKLEFYFGDPTNNEFLKELRLKSIFSKLSLSKANCQKAIEIINIQTEYESLSINSLRQIFLELQFKLNRREMKFFFECFIFESNLCINTKKLLEILNNPVILLKDITNKNKIAIPKNSKETLSIDKEVKSLILFLQEEVEAKNSKIKSLKEENTILIKQLERSTKENFLLKKKLDLLLLN